MVDAVRCAGVLRPSFAFSSITERWPRILTKIVDHFHQRHRDATIKYGQEGDVDVKSIIHSLSRLRYLIVTDKPIETLISAEDDTVLWNADLENFQKELGLQNTTWYKVPWLFSECLMYRLIHQFLLDSKHFGSYDPFLVEKQKAYYDSMPHLLVLGTQLCNFVRTQQSTTDIRTELSRHIQISLWGNKCDLSLSGGDPHFMSDKLFHELVSLRQQILVDDVETACDILMGSNKDKRVDIILDNAGLEVFTDLCLGEVLISQNLASVIVFHGKCFPWYVSDVVSEDMKWVLNELTSSDDEFLKELGQRWNLYFKQGKFVFSSHPFYTYGVPYSSVAERSPDLYSVFKKSSLLIFKGDLNYRKLVGDRDWPLTTPFKVALAGFEPTNILSLRTLKAETVTGLSQKCAEQILSKFGKDKSWMVSSDYAVVQLLKHASDN